MEDYIDPFLSSPSWSELNASSKSSWTSTVASQTNGLFDDSVGAYAGDEKNPSICMIPSTHIIRNITTEDLDLHAHSDNSSVFAGGTLKYLSQEELPNNNLHIAQHENDTQESNYPLNAVFEGNSISESYSQELNTSCSITLPHSGLTMSSSIESTGSESCKFAQSFGDSNSISSVQSLWPPSPYSSISVSPFVEQRKLQGFDFQGVGNEDDAMGKTYIENGIYSHMNSSAAASLQTKFQDSGGLQSPELHSFNLGQQIKMINGGLHPHKQEQNGIHNLQLPNISTGPVMIPAKSAGLQAHQQPTEANSLKHQTNHSSAVAQQATPVNAAGCNGVAKPRVRARRGQATDPHSIAERLRREKIAERMRNLQELVPNSNKTDKASMLDEIIDYVKFLQLQVKVLSMSRLGAAGAVVPLITDAQAEASNLYLSSDLSEAQDNLAFEQEVVKLMESSVTTAMQFLQNKGLCLMPIALASAISIQKGSSSAAIPQDKRQPDGSKIDREKESYNIYIGGSCKQEEFVRSI